MTQQDDFYADDPEHPLPYLGNLDVAGKRRDGGADLGVVISGPLASDERSQRRLMQKIENYLRFINSAEFRGEFGDADAATTRLVVTIDSRSEAAIFELLQRCEAWVREGNATLVVEKR